jgi:hypothetical protein
MLRPIAAASRARPSQAHAKNPPASLFICAVAASDGGCVNGGAYGCALFRTPPGPISPGLGALNR